MKGHLFYENTFIERKSKSVSAIIRQLQGHPDFQDDVLKLWKLFTPLQNSSISYSEFESYYVLILHLLFPIYPRDELAARAKNDLLRLTERPNSDINFYQFCEFFAKLAVLWLEDVSSERAILFINFLYSRTTRKKITKHGKKEEVPGFIFVTFLLPNFLQDTLSIQRKKKLDHNSIFFDETWIEDAETLKKYKADPETLIETEIIPYEEVIPIGFAAENIMTALVNSHQVKMDFPPFEISDPCHKYTIEACKSCPFPMSTTVWTGSKTNLVSEKVETSPTKTFGLLPIIFSPKQSHFVIRMNPALERLTAYERLKDKQDRVKYVNVHSSFYRYEEYKIDLVHRINLQNEFAQQHGKYFDDSNTNPNKNEKHIPPLADVFLKAYQTKLEFADLNKEFESTKASSSITQLSLYKDKDLFWQYQSHFSKALPQDPNDSFEQDLLDYANEQPLFILVIGKPKSGVSTFCKLLAQKLGVQLISIESFIDALLAKIKDKEENPDPEDVDEEGNQKEFLTPTERAIMTSLSEGQAISQEAIIELMNLKLASEFTISRGFILDLPVYENQEKTLAWAQRLVQKEIRLPNEHTFSHVVFLDSQATETRFFASKIMEAPEDQKLTSLFDREILKKPKPKRYDEDGEEIVEEEDEDAPPIPDEKNLLYRPNESEEVLQEAFGNFQQTYEYIHENVIRFLAPSRFIKIDVSGLNANEVLESCLGKMRDVVDPLRPVAIKLEPADDSNLKDLMTQSTEETEVTGLPRRQWSAYRNIDPVALEAGKLVVGKGEFPCAYGGRVFVFESEENQNKFFDNPKKYVNKRPEMPKGYNLAVLGPRKSGKDYVAEFLSERYGWKVVNVEEMIARKLLEMKTWEAYFASNPKTGSIHPNEEEYKEFKKGGAISAASVLPIVLWELGFQLYKKPPPPKTEEELEAEAIALAEEQERLKLEEEKAAKSKKKESKREREERERLEREKAEEEKRLQEEKEAKIAAGEWEEERPPSPPPEDYKLKELGVQPDEEGVVPPVKGFIFVGFPQTEDQVNALKEHGIVLDKILYLVDNSEEPGAALQNKGDYRTEFSLENELEKSEKTLQVVKEGFGEEIVKEIPITFGTEEFKKQVLWAVDPFYVNVDQDGEVVAPGDVGEDDEPVKWGDCGSFCPVALADEGWLLPGKEEFECQVRGKRYRFFTEESLNKFKLAVEDYLQKVNRRNVKTPGPKVLFMGIKGSGVHTQMGLLQKQYRISRVELAADLLRVLNEEKLKRKKQRELMRGFKPKEFNDDGEEIEDPETAEDPSEFDLKAHEIETLQRILAGRDEVIINANMFDVEDGKVSTALAELMSDGRRLPEVCVFMRCTEENMVKRIFKEQEIVDKYNAIMEERKTKFETEKARRIEELLKQKEEEAAAEAAEKAAQAKDEDEEEEGEQEEVEPVAVTEEEIAAIEAELDDGEAPVLEEMVANAKSEFITRRDTETGKLDEYIEAFRSANLPVIEIDSDKTIPTVYEELKFKLREFLDKRENFFEKFHVRAISDEVLPFYEKSYTYRKSKFETGDPKEPWKLPQNKEYPLVYRSRIFFFKSDEERKQAMEVIANLARNEAKPKDVNTNISVFILGKKKTGKSTLAKMLAEKLGLIRIKIKHLLNRVIEYPYWANDLEIEQVLREGRVPEDEQIIELLSKRLQMRDCVEKGYILDGYPQNREQAQLLTEKGIIPDAVFGMEFRRKDVLDRCKKNLKLKDKFGYDNRILHERLDENDEELCYTEAYYISNFNNFSVLDPKISKWGVYDQAQSIIHEVLEQKYNLTIGLITGWPKKIGRINLTQSDILANIGEFMNYSPVSLKSKKLFQNLSIFSPHLYLYNKNLYFLGDQKEGEDFAKNPDQLIQSQLITELKNAPRRLDLNEVVDAHFHRKAELKGNCPVTLGGKGKVVKGEPDISLQYNNQIWYFRGEEELQEFKLNPLKYYKTQLPDKLPINEIQVNNQNDIIKKKAQTGEATAYLEHHLGNITMKAMAQLGNKRLKYPTISYQETALKFMAIALKASNPNKSEEYRKKYAVKLKEFLKHCSFSEEILGEAELRDKKQSESAWNEWDEEAFLKRMEEFHEFMKELKGEDKIEYFKWFIR